MWLLTPYLPTVPRGIYARWPSRQNISGQGPFLFHADRKEDGHLYGDVLMMDLDTLRQDMKENTLYPGGVSMERKDGSRVTVSLEEWNAMELYEKDAPEKLGDSPMNRNRWQEWQNHYSIMFSQWKAQAFSLYAPGSGGTAEHGIYGGCPEPDMDKYRIPLGTARQMLLTGAPVYRLLPSGPEKLAPIAAVTTGLWYENYREFAIAPEDLGALDRLVRRETDRLMGNRPQLHKNEERRPSPER